jgi:hypothetical protein
LRDSKFKNSKACLLTAGRQIQRGRGVGGFGDMRI